MFACYYNKQSGAHFFVTQEEFNRVQDNVRRQFSSKFMDHSIFIYLFLGLVDSFFVCIIN